MRGRTVKVRCDNCGTRYRVDPQKIGVAGKRARCIRCGQVFAIHVSGSKGGMGEGHRDNGPRGEDAARTEPTYLMPPSDPGTAEPDECLIFEDNPGYDLLEPLGQGGMATVTLARDRQLLRQVAIKSMRPGTASPTVLSYFCREAQITAQLDHPNIVPFYTVKPPEHPGDGISFVMKRVQGHTLAERIRTAADLRQTHPSANLPENLNLAARLNHFVKACEGLHFAHQKQVVHRDLKPSNIMVGEFGEVYLMDWGLAGILRRGDGAVEITGPERFVRRRASCEPGIEITTSEAVGTPGYMSPEQARGEIPTDATGDVYAMGMVLFELVTLKPARTGDVAERMQMAKDGVRDNSAPMGGDVLPPPLGAIVDKATARRPRDRYPGVREMAEDVQRFLRDEEVSVYPDNRLRKIWRKLSRNREITVIGLLLLVLVFSLVATWSLWKEHQVMTAGRIREKALTDLQAVVSTHAHAIDSHFLRLGALATNLAAQAVTLMDMAPPTREALYTVSDFQDPWSAPEDFAHSPLYGKKVSLDYPVVKTAPGVDEDGIVGFMQRLAPLRHAFRHTLLGSAGVFAPVAVEDPRHLLTVTGVPVRWVYIGLERGVMYSYPGKATYAADYDPRRRPWYNLGAGRKTLQWGRPYVDVQGQGLVLACAVPLYSPDDRFYGVLGMDVTLSDIIKDQLRRPEEAGGMESYLLDGQGGMVVRSSQVDQVSGSLDPANTPVPEPFAVAPVVAAIRRQRSGVEEMADNRGHRVIVFARLEALGWYYVEEFEAERMFSHTPAP